MQWLSTLQETVASLIPGDVSSSGRQDEADSKLLGSLQSSGILSKAQLLDFFKSGEELLKSEETRRKLKDARLLKQDVEDLVTGLQKQVFERQGVQGDFGIQFLSKASTVYKNDNQLMAALLKFASLEEDALDEAELPPAEYAQNKRLMDLAKAHTAQLMAKLDELPAEQRQAFLQDQIRVAEQLRKSVKEGNAQQEPTAIGSRLGNESVSSMTQEERLTFFRGTQQ